MNETIRNDIIKVLDRIIDILEVKEEKDIIELKELSDHTIHNASIFQDKDSISIAIIIYSLSKIIDRGKPIHDTISIFKNCKNALINKDYQLYEKLIKEIFTIISTNDERLQMFIEQVIRQAEIKKGSKLYVQGISLGRAAEIMGVSQWELMNYVGKTRITDVDVGEKKIKDRLKQARELFNISQ